jgi:predicted nucleic acid-binding protein
LILVDSSVWIEFLSSSPGAAAAHLKSLIEGSEAFALTGVVVAEVLQGLTRDADQIAAFLNQWVRLDPRGFDTYVEAAAIFRTGRANGIALTTIDTLIAAIAIEHHAQVFTLDNDFKRIARFTPLALHTF